jgi:hypothetical protein
MVPHRVGARLPSAGELKVRVQTACRTLALGRAVLVYLRALPVVQNDVAPCTSGVMRPWLTGAVLLGSAVAGILTAVILFRMVCPPDATSAVLSGRWVAMPYLGAAGLAVQLRRHAAALVVLLALPERDPLRCALRGENGSAGEGRPHWKEVSNAPPDGVSNGPPGHLRPKGPGGQQQDGKKANAAQHRRPTGSSARLSTGKALLLELQSSGARSAPRESC